ncbi:hypothetical protein LCGC14_0755550 [marine sediment metagenome]|uniref:Uncharacterized protein n=1 Tax=marine sediment metagenome TaxID=412755 RepID=A0A0F9QML0_9ZZZZ
MGEKKKRLIPTKLGMICYRTLVPPDIANWIILDLGQAGDVEARIEGYIQFLEEARLWGIANEKFLGGSHDLSNEDYKKLEKYKEISKGESDDEDE